MKLVFAGTPPVAVPSLSLLAASGHEIAAVVTRTDAALGRKRVLTPSPVAAAAGELGLPVIKANRLDAETTAAIQALQPDLGVIVAYGGLVREPLLSTPALGWINLHFSLLPRWRGAAPIQRVLDILKTREKPLVLSVEVFNKNYYAQDPLVVAKAAMSKMKAVTARV